MIGLRSSGISAFVIDTNLVAMGLISFVLGLSAWIKIVKIKRYKSHTPQRFIFIYLPCHNAEIFYPNIIVPLNITCFFLQLRQDIFGILELQVLPFVLNKQNMFHFIIQCRQIYFIVIFAPGSSIDLSPLPTYLFKRKRQDLPEITVLQELLPYITNNEELLLLYSSSKMDN